MYVQGTNKQTDKTYTLTDILLLQGIDGNYYYFRYDITIQDIKLANSLWTNEGLYTGRILRIPVIDPGTSFVTIYLSIYQSI